MNGMRDAGSHLYVLDTSVLLHDPGALFQFEDNSIGLPIPVLRQLDAGKRGTSEEARNARQVSRFLDDLLLDTDPARIADGLALPGTPGRPAGRLYFVGDGVGGCPNDAILTVARELAAAGDAVVLVSKDINLRVRAAAFGLRAQDYTSDRVLQDVELLPTGVIAAAPPALRGAGDDRQLADDGTVYPNLFVRAADGFLGRVTGPATRGWAPVRRAGGYGDGGAAAWGVHARNPEQDAALELLTDPQVDLVSLLGPAGTGKTLLTLAAGLAQTFDTRRYREIIMTRATIAIGEDIGHLPGTEEEKMTPWMGALMDNLEVLGDAEHAGGWAQAATRDVLQSRVKIRSMNFMRGRTFLDRFVILDEAQNLTPKQMRTLITRAGHGTKVVCLGNLAQIDTPYLTGTTSGLTYLVQCFRGWPHAGHVTLQRGERSRLADHAIAVL